MGNPKAQLSECFRGIQVLSWRVPWCGLACMQTDSLSPKGASTTNFANSSSHFTAQDKNKLKLLKPPDTKAAPSTLGFKALCRCTHPPILPQDSSQPPTTPTGFGSLWLLLSPCPLARCPGHWPQSPSPVSQTTSFLCPWHSVPLTLPRSLRLLTKPIPRKPSPWV